MALAYPIPDNMVFISTLLLTWLTGNKCPSQFILMLKFENDAVHVQTGFAVIEHRVRRNRIPNEHRERIVRAFEDPREKTRNVNTITARKSAAWFRFICRLAYQDV